MVMVDWDVRCRDCGGEFPFLHGPHPTWVSCGAEETCACGEGIYFDDDLGEWQHNELTECQEPTPTNRTTDE